MAQMQVEAAARRMNRVSWSEKRRDSRLRSGLPVRYEMRPAGGYGNSLTQDVSRGGLKIVTDVFLPKSSLMVLQLDLEPHKVVELTAKVAWSQRIASSYHYQSGLEFVDLNPQNKSEIHRYINAHS